MHPAITATIEESPHLALIAAMIKLAVSDARRGRRDARTFLESPERLYPWLSWLVPDGADVETIQARLLAMIERK